jgi:hypothetical protein
MTWLAQWTLPNMDVMLLKSMTRTSPVNAGWRTIWRALGACTLRGVGAAGGKGGDG